MMLLARLNALDRGEAERELLRVCGSAAWARAVAAARPFADGEALLAAAESAWDALSQEDWAEAFAAHPRIGENRTIRGDVASAWSRDEQSRAAEASATTRARLAAAQGRYEERFGRVFLISAAGRRADEILAACEARLGNDPVAELEITVMEERKIGRLRLERLFAGTADPTTHDRR